MARDFARAFYHSGAWKRVRKAYMALPLQSPYGVVPPGMCERCFARGVLRPADTIHHITHLSPANINNPKYTLSYSNLMRVCRDCHAELHSGTSNLPPSRTFFGPNGEVLEKRNDA